MIRQRRHHPRRPGTRPIRTRRSFPHEGPALDDVLAQRYDHLGQLDEGTFGGPSSTTTARATASRAGPAGEAWPLRRQPPRPVRLSTSAQGEPCWSRPSPAGCCGSVDRWRATSAKSSSTTSGSTSTRSQRRRRARIAADPSWRTPTRQRPSGLDAEKLWVAWERGRAMGQDVLRPLTSGPRRAAIEELRRCGRSRRSTRRWRPCRTIRYAARISCAKAECRSRLPSRRCPSPTGPPP